MRTSFTLLRPSHSQSEFSTSNYLPNSSLIFEIDQFQAENFPLAVALAYYLFKLMFVNISKYSLDFITEMQERGLWGRNRWSAVLNWCWMWRRKHRESSWRKRSAYVLLQPSIFQLLIIVCSQKFSHFFICSGAWKALPALADDRNRNALSWGLISSTEQTFSASTPQFIVSAWHCWTGCSDRQQVT